MNIKHLLQKNLNRTNQDFLKVLASISNTNKFSIFLVGGAVRDSILNIKSKEIDIAISGDIHHFLDVLSPFGIKILQKSQFNTFKVKFKSSIIDISQTRKEAYLPKGSLPSVKASSIEDDLARRDFTVNSLAVEINNSNTFLLIDLFNGLNDIQNKVIKVIHANSFQDDPTRIFRAIRFCNRLSFTLDINTNKLIESNKVYIKDLSPARHLNEYLKILDESKFIDILNFLNDTEIFHYFLNINVDFNDINFDQDLTTNFQFLLVAFPKFQAKNQYLDNLSIYPISKKLISFVKDSYCLSDLMNLLNNNKISEVDVNLLTYLQNINNLSYKLHKFNNPNDSINIDKLQNMIFNSSPLISTDELLQLGINSGPLMGSLLIDISLNRFKGIFNTKNEEINFVNKFIN